ncbi:hypothetical protein [Streptomyces sp. NPDC058374]|uniref:hypothetical protein n=1 Tax=unclassified Streptomyces TaxID=2593676 RepID=UPI003667D12F
MTTESENLTPDIPPVDPSTGTGEPSTARPAPKPDDSPGAPPSSVPPEQETDASDAPEYEPGAFDAPEQEPGAFDAPEQESGAFDAPDYETGTDPVSGLVRTAVTARSIDEVVDLIRLLEDSPGGAEAAEEVLRAAAVERPVDDVSELVARLSQPPQPVDRADKAIHTAAARRSIGDVSHLVALLHRPPHGPHAGEEAVQAAATGLTVEELAELISQLEAERTAQAEAEPPSAATPTEGLSEEPTGAPSPHGGFQGAAQAHGTAAAAAMPTAADVPPPDAPAARPARPQQPRRRQPSHARPSLPEIPRDRSATPTGALPLWLRWTTAAALLLCGATHFPLQRADLSASAYGLSIGVAALCLLLAAGSLLRQVLPVLIAGILSMGALTAAHLLTPTSGPEALASAMERGGAPATLTAVVAGMVSLLAFTVLLTRDRTRGGERAEADPGTRSSRRIRPDRV